MTQTGAVGAYGHLVLRPVVKAARRGPCRVCSAGTCTGDAEESQTCQLATCEGNMSELVPMQLKRFITKSHVIGVLEDCSSRQIDKCINESDI